MAQLPGYGGEKGFLNLYNFSGTASNGAALLILPKQLSRSYLRLQNTSDTVMRVGMGPATAIATVTAGVMASIAVGNAGFGYTIPPLVRFKGGGKWNPMVLGAPLAAGLGAAEPTTPATATAVLSTGTIGSVTVDTPGAGYTDAYPPYVYLENDPQDPYGCFAPSATAGASLAAGAVLEFNGSSCPTDPIAIFCAAASKTFECWVIQ